MSIQSINKTGDYRTGLENGMVRIIYTDERFVFAVYPDHPNQGLLDEIQEWLDEGNTIEPYE